MSNQKVPNCVGAGTTEQHIFESDLPLLKNNITILALSDVCFEIILSNLAFREQISFARVCKRFRDAFGMYGQRHYRKIRWKDLDTVDLWYARDFFRFAGAYVEHLVGKQNWKNYPHYIDYVRTYCSQLRGLHLNECNVNDEIIESLKHLTQLEKLLLGDNLQITGKHISHFVHLKKLILRGCGLKLVHIEEIVRNLTNLTLLDVSCTYVVTTDLIDEMVKYSQKLQILKFAVRGCSYYRVAHLPSIKYLEISQIDGDMAESCKMLRELVAQKANEIEVLTILSKSKITENDINLISKLKKLKILDIGNHSINDKMLKNLCNLEELEELSISMSREVTNQGVGEFLTSCKRLHHLSIPYCESISNDFVSAAIPVLECSGAERKKPFSIYVNGTKINIRFLRESGRYKNAGDSLLLQLFNYLPSLPYKIEVNDILKRNHFRNLHRRNNWLLNTKHPTLANEV